MSIFMIPRTKKSQFKQRDEQKMVLGVLNQNLLFPFNLLLDEMNMTFKSQIKKWLLRKVFLVLHNVSIECSMVLE